MALYFCWWGYAHQVVYHVGSALRAVPGPVITQVKPWRGSISRVSLSVIGWMAV